jgi:Uma2 family endonuclease
MLTERNPDSVRGPDVAFYSYKRVPRGPLSPVLLPVAPELVFEVRSPSDRWIMLHEKIAEYLGAGVQCVCVLDDENTNIHAFYTDREPQVLEADDEFALPGILGEFQVTVRRFFE